MTAIIGILNKSAVAIAADSAVTVGAGNNYKVYNHANKIFNLSIGNPIAIMIYSSAEFVGIPWETVIKLYRKHSGNKKFRFTHQYMTDFIKYLKTLKKHFGRDEEQNTLAETVTKILNELEAELGEKIIDRFPVQSDWIKLDVPERVSVFREEIENILLIKQNQIKTRAKMNNLRGVSVQRLISRHKKLIVEIADQCLNEYNLSGDKELNRLITSIVCNSLTKLVFFESTTGLVFTGFGEDELYPSLYSVSIGGVVEKQFRYQIDDRSVTISSDNLAAITPFAQTDIMRTFVEGIDPSLRDSIPIAFLSALEEFKKFILDKIDYSSTTERKLKKLLEKNIPRLVDALVYRLEGLREESHISPMLLTISSLSKQDLTDMAESLINLTYLKRRASFSEESVGGPIDVAVITKGDGFIWIKRKNYFRPELNINYISKVQKLKS